MESEYPSIVFLSIFEYDFSNRHGSSVGESALGFQAVPSST